MVHYPLYLQNKLPFEVSLHSRWTDGTTNTQNLAPCVWKSLRYPNTKYTSRFSGTRINRRQLESLRILNQDEYQMHIDGKRVEDVLQRKRGRPYALELVLEAGELRYSIERKWFRCIRVLNQFDFPITIDFLYDDGSTTVVEAQGHEIFFLGTFQLGRFDKSNPNFWDRLRFKTHHTRVKRMVVRSGSHIIHELHRREVTRQFRDYYIRPHLGSTCMNLNETGFEFLGTCNQLSEVCNENQCRFES